MNGEFIIREARVLLQEVAAYEEPRLFLDDAPTLSKIAKLQNSNQKEPKQVIKSTATASKGHVKDIKDTKSIKDRSNAVLSVIKNKGKASIKDISTLIRGVSEKTIQRELMTLINAGIVLKHGERRWSTYSLA